MSEDEFAGTLLENEELFYGLIQAVHKAGEPVVVNPNSVCVLPIGQNGITRRTRPIEINVNRSVVNLDKRSITLVGGGAVQAYNFAIKDRIGFEYKNPTKKTTDLDFVWWPTITLPGTISNLVKTHGTSLDTSKYDWFKTEPFKYSDEPISYDGHFTVVSTSPVIQDVVHQFEQQLANQLEEYSKTYADAILAIASNVYKTSDLILGIQTNIKNVFIAGICNVFGSLIITANGTDHIIQIIEMTIHDGASSQISTKLENAVSDPMFSIYTNQPQGTISNISLYHNSKIYTVPVLDRLMEQQFFALQNHYKYLYGQSRNEKLETHFRRCHYIYYGILGKFLSGINLNIANSPIFSNPEKMRNDYSMLFENTEAWIASCVLPSTDICGISRENKLFKTLCESRKMIKMDLCTPPTTSQQQPPHAPQTQQLNYQLHSLYQLYEFHRSKAYEAYERAKYAHMRGDIRELQNAQNDQTYHQNAANNAMQKYYQITGQSSSLLGSYPGKSHYTGMGSRRRKGRKSRKNSKLTRNRRR